MKTVERIKMSPNFFSQLFNDIMAANGEITEQNQTKVVYKQKMGRMQNSVRKKMMYSKKGRKINGLMFDKRKEDCKTCKPNETAKIENCSIIIFTILAIRSKGDVKWPRRKGEPRRKLGLRESDLSKFQI